MNFEAVNREIVAYMADPTAREDAAGHAQDLLQTVRDLVRESLTIPTHWNTRSPLAGAVLVKREMKRRHQELDEPALDALAEHFASRCP